MFSISTVIYILAGIFIIWGVFNEDKLIDFEDRLYIKLKNKIEGSKHK